MSTNPSKAETPSFGLPRRFLRPLLLLSLAQVERSHGYELAEAVRECGLNVDMAGVYRELRALEQRDVLDSDWEPSESGPERRVYELTAQGRLVAEAAIAELALARDLLTSALATIPNSNSNPDLDRERNDRPFDLSVTTAGHRSGNG